MLGCPGLVTAARAGQRHHRQRGRQRRRRRQAHLHLPAGPDALLPRRGAGAAQRATPGGSRSRVRCEEVLDRLDELVVKPVDGSGGKGLVIGPQARPASSTRCAKRLRRRPARLDRPAGGAAVDGADPRRRPLAPRHVDLRPFAVNDGDDVWVLPGGLTRVALVGGLARRQLQPGRRIEGHLGARWRTAPLGHAASDRLPPAGRLRTRCRPGSAGRRTAAIRNSNSSSRRRPAVRAC